MFRTKVEQRWLLGESGPMRGGHGATTFGLECPPSPHRITAMVAGIDDRKHNRVQYIDIYDPSPSLGQGQT